MIKHKIYCWSASERLIAEQCVKIEMRAYHHEMVLIQRFDDHSKKDRITLFLKRPFSGFEEQILFCKAHAFTVGYHRGRLDAQKKLRKTKGI